MADQGADDWIAAPPGHPTAGADDWVSAPAPVVQNVSRETPASAATTPTSDAAIPNRILIQRKLAATPVVPGSLRAGAEDVSRAIAAPWTDEDTALNIAGTTRAQEGEIKDYSELGKVAARTIAAPQNVMNNAFASVMRGAGRTVADIGSTLGLPGAEKLGRDVAGMIESETMRHMGEHGSPSFYRAPTPAGATLERIATGDTSGQQPQPNRPPAKDTSQASGPPGAPHPDLPIGQTIGLKIPGTAPRRFTVDGYFGNGQFVRGRYDNGEEAHLGVPEVLRDRTDAPPPFSAAEPIQRGPQLTPEESAAPPLGEDDWSAPQRPPSPATLGAESLRALDTAHGLERAALYPGTTLSGAARQDMLAEAARLRRIHGFDAENAGVPPNAYRHPLAEEPVGGLGELAAARVANPDLYQGGPRVPPAPDADLHQALADVGTAREPMPSEPSVLDAIREMGGIRTRDAQGNPTREGAEIENILTDYKNPRFTKRLVNNETGAEPDKLREALQQRGWFGRMGDDAYGGQRLETGSYPGDDISELYDMLDREARGEKVYHPESDIGSELEYRRMLEEDMGRAGIGASDDPHTAARKLADYRKAALADRAVADRMGGIDAELESTMDDADWNRLLSEERYEPGSDLGAEHETAEVPRSDVAASGGEPEISGRAARSAGEAEGAGALLQDAAAERATGRQGVEPTRFQRDEPPPKYAEDLINTDEGTEANPIVRQRPQLVIPGAERAAEPTERQKLEQKMAGRAKPQVGQKATHGLGLFDPNAPLEEGGKKKGDTGQGTLFQRPAEPTFFSALGRGIDGLKQDKAPAAQWSGIIDNLPGVKKEEVQWSGVKEWLASQKGPVTKAALQAFLRENDVRVQEVMRGDQYEVAKELGFSPEEWNSMSRSDQEGAARAEGISLPPEQPAKYGQYTLPGGDNYRELLLTLPPNDTVTREPSVSPQGWGTTDGGTQGFVERGNTGADYRSSHWSEPNVLAHIRFDDRTGPNGEKILHIAEVQSDWHQKGRKQGYRESPAKPDDLVDAQHEDGMRWGFTDRRTGAREVGHGNNEAEARSAALGHVNSELRTASRVPDAPFKQSWHELAMKRMLRYASANGYSKLSWDTGDTNADRYDLSRQVDHILYKKNEDGTYRVSAQDEVGRGHLLGDAITEKQLEDHVGKDVAGRIVDGVGNDTNLGSGSGTSQRDIWKKLSGGDLKVGGEGMRGFYDRILPQFMNRYAKKWGAKVSADTLPGEQSARGLSPAERMRFDDLEAIEDRRGLDAAEERELNELHKRATTPTPSAAVHSVPITDAMRESVMQGQPLFQQGAPRVGGNVFKGEPVKLTDDLIGRTIGDSVTPEEARTLNAVEKEAGRIVPRATVRPMRAIAQGEAFRRQSGSAREGTVTGATYSNGARRLIAWSLESPDAVGTLRHEAVHYLRGRGLISPKEWAALEKASAREGWLDKHDIERRYPELSEEHQHEEAIADQFGQWKRAPDSVPKMFKPMVERIAKFMAKVADHARRFMGKDVTADDVMSRMASGEVGRRGGDYREQPEFARAQSMPNNMTEAGDRLDEAAQAKADALKGAPPGVYATTLRAMSPPSGDYIYRDMNLAQNGVMRPETLARMDTGFAKVWNEEKARDNTGNALTDELRSHIAPTFLKLNEKSRNKVYAAREIDRINGVTRTDDGRSIIAVNKDSGFAHFTRPGTFVALTPEETAAYHEMSAMFDRAWKNVMEGAARKVGWQGPWDRDDMSANIKAASDMAATTGDLGLQKSAARTVKILSALDQNRRAGYMPLMRFGDYFIHAAPKTGVDRASLGGYPALEHFQLAEPGVRSEIFGGKRVGNQPPDYARQMIADVQAKYPSDKFDVRHGYLWRDPSMLDQVDIPAIEKLMMFTQNDMLRDMRDELVARGASKADAAAEAARKYDSLYGKMIDTLWDKTFAELEAGYKKQSRTVAGYSDDFGRALGTYMHWTARGAADNIHRAARDDAYAALDADPRESRKVKDFARNWREWRDRPSNLLNHMANGMAKAGFLEAMGMSPSSTAVVGSHGLVMAGPTLRVGVGMGKAAPAYANAWRQALALTRVDASGIHIDDASKAGRTPAERAYLKRLDAEGALHSRAIEDMAALNETQSSLWGSARSSARKFMDMALSNVSFMDRANRIASALSSYRLASDPKTLAKMDAAWRGNQIWRTLRESGPVTPERMSRFMISQMVGEYGPMNKAPLERNVLGQSLMGMHGFTSRLVGSMFKLAKMGPEGRAALYWTLGAFGMMAGVNGIPFVQDVQNIADQVWKFATKRDPMIGYRIQSGLASVFGKVGAEMILHGPVSTLTGVDVGSRLGLGDLGTRTFSSVETLGSYPAILWGRVQAAQRRFASGQNAAGAAELIPVAGPRNAALATIEAQQGLKSQSGRTKIPASKITPFDTAVRATGFRSMHEQRAYASDDFEYRAKHAKMRPPRNPVPTP